MTSSQVRDRKIWSQCVSIEFGEHTNELDDALTFEVSVGPFLSMECS